MQISWVHLIIIFTLHFADVSPRQIATETYLLGDKFMMSTSGGSSFPGILFS